MAVLGVLADIHGNSWALEAVLKHAEALGVRQFVNLGDVLYGPLDPIGTFRLLERVPMTTISGNQDRLLVKPGARATEATVEKVLQNLGQGPVEWLAGLPARATFDEALLFHGTPGSDTTYLLEDVSTGRPRVRSERELVELLGPTAAPLALCGHSHVARAVALPDGRLIVNPGSVGLPAYDDDSPCAHEMEMYSPHASYATIVRSGAGWDVSFHRVAYEWRKAVEAAEGFGRADWAYQVATGRARRGV